MTRTGLAMSNPPTSEVPRTTRRHPNLERTPSNGARSLGPARAGEIAEFTGVSAPYDVPVDAELVIRTAECTPEEGVARLVEAVLEAVRRPEP